MQFFKAQIKNQFFDIAYIHKQRSKELILFFHGIACTKNGFRHLYDDPIFHDYSLLFYDMVGHGDSSNPDNFSYSMEDQAAVTCLLIQELGLEQVNAVGHSMGGAIGLLLTQQIQTKLKSFISSG